MSGNKQDNGAGTGEATPTATQQRQRAVPGPSGLPPVPLPDGATADERMSDERPPVPLPPDAGGAGAPARRRRKWLVPVVAGVAVIVLAGGGVFGWHAWTTHQFEQAKAACAEASDRTRVAANTYNALLNGRAAKAGAITGDQVKDKKTATTLADALAMESPVYAGCVADDKPGLDEAIVKLDQQTAWYQSHEKSLLKAVKAVEASHAAKQLDDAKTALKSSMDTGETKYKESEGKVADENTRANLRSVLDGAKSVAEGGSKDPKTFTDEKAKVDQAVKAVDDSVNAKAEADRKAAEEAQAQAAAGSTGSASTRRNTGSARRSTGSTGNGGNRGTTSRPNSGGGSGTTGGSGSSGGGGSTSNGGSSGPQWIDGCEVSPSHPYCEGDWIPW